MVGRAVRARQRDVQDLTRKAVAASFNEENPDTGNPKSDTTYSARYCHLKDKVMLPCTHEEASEDDRILLMLREQNQNWEQIAEAFAARSCGTTKQSRSGRGKVAGRINNRPAMPALIQQHYTRMKARFTQCAAAELAGSTHNAGDYEDYSDDDSDVPLLSKWSKLHGRQQSSKGKKL